VRLSQSPHTSHIITSYTAEMVNPGTYTIKNVKGGTALDLSGGDNRSIIGFSFHGQGNQQWEVSERDGNNEVTIKSVATGKYLSIDQQPSNGIPVIASDNAQKWRIANDEHNGNAFRVYYPGTEFNFDLQDHGNSTPGTLIQLWEKTPGKGQTWYFESV